MSSGVVRLIQVGRQLHATHAVNPTIDPLPWFSVAEPAEGLEGLGFSGDVANKAADNGLPNDQV